MATERKLDVLLCTFPYGGNGASASTHPDAQIWIDDLYHTIPDDSRVGRVERLAFNDTPITMTRNAAVAAAREEGYDVLVMVDSDQKPDLPCDGAEPFWDAAFNFLYDHYDKGPVVVGAPYVGGPPVENDFVFHWENRESLNPNADIALLQYSRSEASFMAGIQECAALPTGVTMYDVRAFELTDPHQSDWHERVSQAWIDRIWRGETTFTEVDVRAMADQYATARFQNEQSWFYYEYNDQYQAEKSSTEDVTATRDIGMIGQLKLGYNPIHCAWSSWAGHWKPKCVGPPVLVTQDDVAEKYKRAALAGTEANVTQVELSTPIADETDWSNVARFSGGGKLRWSTTPLAEQDIQIDGDGNGHDCLGVEEGPTAG